METRNVHGFSDACAESQPNVILDLAFKTQSADHSQGESGIRRNGSTRANSLRLKILPLSS
jgi:hypothetical protein